VSKLPVTLNRAAINTSGVGVRFAVSVNAKAYSMTVIPLSPGPLRISKLPQKVSMKKLRHVHLKVYHRTFCDEVRHGSGHERKYVLGD
jgi:hypothetical protein